jgi:hypothetical protein
MSSQLPDSIGLQDKSPVYYVYRYFGSLARKDEQINDNLARLIVRFIVVLKEKSSQCVHIFNLHNLVFREPSNWPSFLFALSVTCIQQIVVAVMHECQG